MIDTILRVLWDIICLFTLISLVGVAGFVMFGVLASIWIMVRKK